jgi:polyhydroxybutyrate depolymerase
MTVRRRLALVLLAAVAALAACDRPAGPAAPAVPTGAPGQTVTVNLADRPFQLHIPTSYQAGVKVPLVVLLHGYTASGAQQESYFKLTPESDRRGFLYAMPDGTENSRGQRFWNATPACCDFERTGVDDSSYLASLIDTVVASYAVDPARVFIAGHSNGGFMAHRMACDHADKVTAIVSLAGAMNADRSRCKPSGPVSILEIHGTSDETIGYDGGANASNSFPSVTTTISDWRLLDGCADDPNPRSRRLDLVTDLPGAETSVTAYTCRNLSTVELWSIKSGVHVPSLSENFAPAVIDFLYAQPSR